MAEMTSEMQRYLDGEMTEQEAEKFEEYLMEHGTDDEWAWVIADTELMMAARELPQ